MDTGFRIVEIIFILAGALMLAACGNKSGLVPVQTENIESNADNVMTDTRIPGRLKHPSSIDISSPDTSRI